MPIRLNLLAEAQAIEDMRRRDPVKRAMLAGIISVSIMVLWSVSLWLKAIAYNSEISSTEKLLELHSQENKEVLNNLKQSVDIDQKLAALDKLSTNRFLVANLMNAMQQTVVEDVQLTRLRMDDDLIFNEEVKANPAIKRAAKPASVTEKIVLTLDAKDACPHPGDLIPKFQQRIADATYFEAMLDKSDSQRVHLKEGSYIAQQMGVNGRAFQPFTLECRFPEKTR
jgi:hypothetical protein